jgi:cystathionine beta-lyase/cystathionine gamma-synthase
MSDGGPRPYGSRGDAPPAERPLAPDLTRSTTFAYDSAERLRAVAAGEVAGEFYPRYGHPAARALESAIAGLEGADGAVSFASGMAALFAVFAGLAGEGDAIAVSRQVYGGVESVLTADLPRFGIEVRRFDPFEPADLDAALSGALRLVHVETPTNPLCRVVDLERIAERAHRCQALLCVDATFVPPPLQQPLRHGADLVVQSATKGLGGHSDVQAGIVSGRHALLERLEAFRRRTGAILAPDAAWLLLRSLATLELRARRAAETALRIARFLEARRAAGSKVARVHYPGLASHPDREVARRYLEGFGSMLSFEVHGGLSEAIRVYDRLQRIARAVSLGGVHSLASLPAHTSHAMLTPDQRQRAGIPEGLIRLSVGVEQPEDLEGDLRAALEP